MNISNICSYGLWKVPYIASSLGGVKLGTNGHINLFDWVTIQLTKLNDQRDVVELLKPTSLALQIDILY